MPYSRTPEIGNASAARYIFARRKEGCTHLSIIGQLANLKSKLLRSVKLSIQQTRCCGRLGSGVPDDDGPDDDNGDCYDGYDSM